MKKVIIVGAGLTGSLLAINLAKRGYAVEIYESRSDMRHNQVEGGRSISLAISARGIHALNEVGLADKVLVHAVPMYSRMIHNSAEQVYELPYSNKSEEHINAISRSVLNTVLLNAAEAFQNVSIRFETRVRDIDLTENTLRLGSDELIEFEHVIAADGYASMLRKKVAQAGLIKFNVEPLGHSYKEIRISAAHGKTLGLNHLHIWPRQEFMLIGLPNPDHSFTGTLFLPNEGESSFKNLSSPAKIGMFFAREFPELVNLIPNIVEEFEHHPTGHLETVKCWPWNVEDKLLLMGDAAHAIVPFFGQGMNCAFEDVTVFNECLNEGSDDWENLFSRFSEARRGNTDAIAEMSKQNYLEMRSKVTDEGFTLRKQVEHELMNRYPDRYIPQYNLVSFQRVSYSYAHETGIKQNSLLEKICKGIKDISEIDWGMVEQLMT